MARNWSGEVAIVGAHEHPERLLPDRHAFAIQMECIARALEDAGLTFADVDGLASATGEPPEGGGIMAAGEVAEYLGIVPRFIDSTEMGGASPLTQIGHAAAAIASGQAEVVVVSYAATTRSYEGTLGTWEADLPPDGPGQFEQPYGMTTIGSYALFAQRHMHEFGTTSAQLAEIAVVCRAHAADNPQARYRTPLSIDDVLDGPMLCSPLRRYDCCIITDGGGAVVMTSADRAKDCRKRPVHILGFGEASTQVQLGQMQSFTSTAGVYSGRDAFAQAGITPGAVDALQLYDSFTITALMTTEDLGFCAKGDGGSFVENGRIAIGGELPVNTDGGGLSSNQPGRRGIFSVIESVRQLRGEPLGRQVPDCRTMVAHGSGGWPSCAATLVLGV
jgi:acetyl-CoA C-acetyltransferase